MAAGSHIEFHLDFILDHPRSAIVGFSLILKFGLDFAYSFGDIAIFTFGRRGLKLPIHGYFLGLLGAYFPKYGYFIWIIWIPIVLTIKGTIFVRKHIVRATKHDNRSSVRPGRRIEKKREVQDRTGLLHSQNSHKVVIFRLFGEKIPTAPIETKICMANNVADVITYANFQDDIFGVLFYRGSNFPFSY